MHELITATVCIKRLNKNNIHMKKGYFSQLVSAGKIPHHSKQGSPKDFYIFEEVVIALENKKDHSCADQVEANKKKRGEEQKKDDNGLLDKSVEPQNSVATMSEAEKKKRDEELAATFRRLEDKSTEEENDTRPGVDASGADWNVFKTKQQALNYELDRKLKEGSLLYLDDFKAAAEVLLSPLNQGLEDMAFKFKAKFPDVSDEKIEWLLDSTNKLKVDVQNVVV